MLQDLTPASFEEHLGTRFRVHVGQERSLDLMLYQIARHEKHPGPRSEPFSAFFRGPREVILPQAIYSLEHERLGALELFLVPIGPDGQGMGYEAVFN